MMFALAHDKGRFAEVHVNTEATSTNNSGGGPGEAPDLRV